MAPPNVERFGRDARRMSGLTIVSRFAGLLRDKVCAYYVGVGTQWSAFWIGFIFPNLYRRIFGEGALTSAFVPAYSETLHTRGPEAANRLASATATLLVLVLMAITLIGEAIAIPIALSEGVSTYNRLAATMTAIMLPYGVLVCLVALMGAIGTVHGRFAAQAISPVILNLCMAGAAAFSVLVMTRSYPLERRVVWVALSVLAAGILQVLLMLPTLRRSGVRLQPTLDFRGAGVAAVVIPLLPVIIGFSAVQINTALDSQIAWWLSPDGHDARESFKLLGWTIHTPMEGGAVAKLSIAQRIYLLPVGIFGVAMATAIFPVMARAASAGDQGELKRLLVAGLRKTLFLSIPSSLGMMLVAGPLITLIYLGGQVSEAEVNRAYRTAVFYCAGIWAFEAQMVILRVYYALRDTWTPAKVAMGMVALNLTLNLTLVWFLGEGGIALATTIAAVTQGTILLVILRRRLGTLDLRKILTDAALGLLAATVMLQFGFLLWLIPMPWEPQGLLIADEAARMQAKLWTALVKLPLLVGICAAIYLGLARYLRMEEVNHVPVIGRWLRTR